MNKIYSVLVLKNKRSFLYGSEKDKNIGTVVRVPFRSKAELGIILEKKDGTENKNLELKEIDESFVVAYQSFFLLLLKNFCELKHFDFEKLLSFSKSILEVTVETIEKNKKDLSSDLKPTERRNKKRHKTFLLEDFLNFIKGHLEVNKEINLIFSTKNSSLRELYEKLREKKLPVFILGTRKKETKEAIKNLLSLKGGFYFLTRKALFFPFGKIDNLFVLEYNETELFIEDRSPKFSYLDLAKTIARSQNSNLFLESRTPFLSDFRKFKKIGNFKRKTVPFSEVEIIKKEKGAFWLSKRVRDLAIEEIEKNNGNILFLWEKRGFAKSFSCRNCGFDFICPDCNSPLSLKDGKVICEFCKRKFNTKEYDQCPRCKSFEFSYFSKGVELLADEISKELEIDKSKVFFFSKDTKSKEKKEIFENLKNGGNILVSTSKIFDETDFKNLNFKLFCVIRLDFLFKIEDELSDERFFQKVFKLDLIAKRNFERSIFQVEKESGIVNWALTRNLNDFFAFKLQRQSESATQSQIQNV